MINNLNEWEYLGNCVQDFENMDRKCWPKIMMNEGLSHRKKTWMRQSIKWLGMWNIKLQGCPNINVEVKKLVIGKFKIATWTNHIGQKKVYYIKVFNPTWEHGDKAYLGAAIKGKAKVLGLIEDTFIISNVTCRWKRHKQE